MAIEVIMPKVDMDQETGTVIEWKKKNRDIVKEGETILIIETEKVAMDVEATDSGIIDGIQGEPGDVIPIGTVIAYLLEDGEELPEEPNISDVSDSVSVQAEVSSATKVKVSPVAKNFATAHGVDVKDIVGTGVRNQVIKADIETYLSSLSSSAQESKNDNGKIYATPAARRIGREKEIDLLGIAGSGPNGRIQAADVENHQPNYISSPTTPMSAFLPAGEIIEDQVIPLIGMRRTISERLTKSYQSTPHINFTSTVDMTKFNEARKDFNKFAEKENQSRVSATAFIVKLVAMALQKNPYLNSSLQDDNIILHGEINVGVAVALTDGLIVPVVKHANLKQISRIGWEVKDLSVRARGGQLVPSDVSGGTFTISNLGPFGVEQFAAIINPPQSAILAVGSTQNEAIVLDDNQIVSRPIMRFTLTADHRIVDGAVAAHFVSELKALLENPILHTY